MVEVSSVGVTVDHGAAEFQVAQAALQLVRGGLGVLHGKMCEAGVAVRPLLHFTRQDVVRLARFGDGLAWIALDLDAGAGERQHGALDPGLVHRLQAHVAEIGKTRVQPAANVRIDILDGLRPVVFQPGTQEVLFQSDLLHHAFPRARFPSGHLYRNLVRLY
jgi:hypothetical protein